MPDVWAKAFAPTIALFGWTTMPVILLTRRLVFEDLFGTNLRVGLIEILPGPKSHDNFFQRSVPCPLTDAIDRALDLARPVHDRRQDYWQPRVPDRCGNGLKSPPAPLFGTLSVIRLISPPNS